MARSEKRISKEQLAYAAGVLDGEGWIGVNYRVAPVRGIRYRVYQIQVNISNTNPILGQWLKLLWGGNISKHQPKHKRWKMRYDYRLTNASAIGFLKDVRPFLLLKQAQADLAFQITEIKNRKEFNPTRNEKGQLTSGGWRIESTAWNELAILKEQMHDLNRKGATLQ